MLEIEHDASEAHLYDYQQCEDSIGPIKIKLLSYEIEHDPSVTQKDVYQSCEIPCDH